MRFQRPQADLRGRMVFISARAASSSASQWPVSGDEVRESGVFSVVVFCGDYPPSCYFDRKGSRLSVMLRKWVAGETPRPTGWQGPPLCSNLALRSS